MSLDLVALFSSYSASAGLAQWGRSCLHPGFPGGKCSPWEALLHGDFSQVADPKGQSPGMTSKNGWSTLKLPRRQYPLAGSVPTGSTSLALLHTSPSLPQALEVEGHGTSVFSPSASSPSSSPFFSSHFHYFSSSSPSPASKDHF